MRIEHRPCWNAYDAYEEAVPTSKFEEEILYHLKYRWVDEKGFVNFSYDVKDLINDGKAECLLPKKFRWLAEAMYYLYGNNEYIIWWDPSDEVILGVAKYCHSRKNKLLRLAAWNRRHHSSNSIEFYKYFIEMGGFNVEP